MRIITPTILHFLSKIYIFLHTIFIGFIHSKELQTELSDQRVTLELVNETGSEVTRRASDDLSRQEQIRIDLADLNSNFDRIAQEIQNQNRDLENALEQLQQLHVKSHFKS